MPENVTPEKIKEILKNNGIESLDDLASLLAENEESPTGSVLRNALEGNGELESSWIIKVLKLAPHTGAINLDEVPPSILGNPQ